MNITLIRNKITTLNTYLFMSLFLFIPFSVAAGSILSISILILWLTSSNLKKDFIYFKSNKVLVSIWLFFLLHIIGFIWTNDINWGLYFLKREWKIFMVPVFMLYARKEYIHYYISLFILSMTISELLSYSIFFEVIPPFLHATVSDPTPFIDHITYNPFLTVSIYLLAHTIIFNEKTSFIRKIFFSIAISTMTINMFITGGRSGQVIFFISIIIIIVQLFKNKILKSIIISSLIICSTLILAYNNSPIFKQRIDMSLYSISNYKSEITSTTLRINFAINSAEIFSNHPLIGVGTGDFVSEYKKMNTKNSPHLKATTNPHNMYSLVMVQFGLLGIISLLFIFYSQIKFSLNNNSQIYRIGITLPLLFLVLNFGESYLLVHSTGLLFSIFSGFLYKDYDNNYKST